MFQNATIIWTAELLACFVLVVFGLKGSRLIFYFPLLEIRDFKMQFAPVLPSHRFISAGYSFVTFCSSRAVDCGSIPRIALKRKQGSDNGPLARPVVPFKSLDESQGGLKGGLDSRLTPMIT